jgi:hypothetical protein
LYFGGREIEITIKSGSPGDTLTLGSSGAMFTVDSGVTLILEDITLIGRNPNTGDAVVLINDGGTLIMKTGSKITGNNNTSLIGTGFSTSTQGGGVRLTSGGILNINGGRIEGNFAVFGGGVYNIDGTVNMTSGEISGNTIIRGSSGVEQGGGFVDFGTFNMYGGYIRNNTSSYVAGGGTIGGTFNLHDGEISNNKAGFGGGLGVGGVLNIHGGKISDNEALRNGGIENYGTVNMFDGEISDNTATGSSESSAGGVYNNEQATFNMFGGKISGNLATDGGGVDNWGTFNMRGGIISGNIAIWYGGGVFNGGTFRISDGIIYGMDALDDLKNIVIITDPEEVPLLTAAFALNAESSTVRGRWVGDNFGRLGTFTTSMNNTLRVVNGLIVP